MGDQPARCTNTDTPELQGYQPPTIRKGSWGFSTFVQNCFEGFPFVKSHQLTWERKCRRGQIRRKAGAGDDLGQWKYLLLALDPRLWSTLIKTYQFSYFRAPNSPQVSEGQQVFPANMVSETSLRFLPSQDSSSASRVHVQVHFPLQHPLISISLTSRSFPNLPHFSGAQKISIFLRLETLELNPRKLFFLAFHLTCLNQWTVRV